MKNEIENKPKKSLAKKIFLKFVFLGIVFLIVFFSINSYIFLSSRNNIYNNIKEVPSAQTALVLGARVLSDGRLSDILKDRLDTAIELYQSGKVEKLLLSGDHGGKYYDEVNPMKDYVLSKGIPATDIFLDHAGFDTYDSIYRAKNIFTAESLIIVTQEFHLPRAIFIAEKLNINAYGVKADKQTYVAIKKFMLRERFAQVKAFLDIILKSEPEYLGEKIPITGDSQKSWD